MLLVLSVKCVVYFGQTFFMALGINQVTYSDRKFCWSVGPGFATLGTST